MVKNYRFAGVELTVEAPAQIMYQDERTLEPFLVDEVKDPHHFVFSVVDNLSQPTGKHVATTENFMIYWDQECRLRYTGVRRNDWKTATVRAKHEGKKHFVELRSDVYGQGMSAKTALNSAEVEHLVIQADGVVFHSSCIDVDGSSVLFTAPSGTGKSTQAALWEKLRNSAIINGDRNVIRCTDGGILSDCIPFAGSSQICKNRTLPLAAIVYLEQSPQTTIRRLRGADAFRSVWEGISVNTWDPEDLSKAMDVVRQVVLNVPVYHLCCTPDESSVIALEKVLRKRASS